MKHFSEEEIIGAIQASLNSTMLNEYHCFTCEDEQKDLEETWGRDAEMHFDYDYCLKVEVKRLDRTQQRSDRLYAFVDCVFIWKNRGETFSHDLMVTCAEDNGKIFVWSYS